MSSQLPRVPPTEDLERRLFDTKVKERLEVITAAGRGRPIVPLSDAASTAEIVAKVNEIIARLQA